MDENKNTQVNEPQENKKKNKGLYLKIVIIAVCCSLLGGIIGGGTVAIADNIVDGISSEVVENAGKALMKSGFRFRHPFLNAAGTAKNFIEEEIIKESYIGISVSDSTDPEGARVEKVEKGGPADRGGLRTNDIVTMVNNLKVSDGKELAEMIGRANSGDEITITVYRDTETIDITVVVGEHSRLDK